MTHRTIVRLGKEMRLSELRSLVSEAADYQQAIAELETKQGDPVAIELGLTYCRDKLTEVEVQTQRGGAVRTMTDAENERCQIVACVMREIANVIGDYELWPYDTERGRDVPFELKAILADRADELATASTVGILANSLIASDDSFTESDGENPMTS